MSYLSDSRCRPALGLLGLLLATGCVSAPASVQAQQSGPNTRAVAGPNRSAAPVNAADEPGKWAFQPEPDDFREDALLDLRYLNEKVAGESGFIKTDTRGDFVLGNGKPVRFWAVNTSVGREKPFTPRPQGRKTEPDLDRHARFLAKRGVNMTRLHAHINPGKDQPITALNEKERDWIWRHVAAMKKQGIYTTISPYWANTTNIGPGWGIPGGENSHNMLFFDERLQAAYKGWLKALFAEKNPHTGIPLAQDASVAIIQLQNEDSLLFWTFNNLKDERKRALSKKFGDFLVKKYGKLDAAFTAWGNHGLPGDDRAAGVVDLHNIWEMTQQRSGGQAKRLDDQLEFLARTMYDFNKSMAAYLRNELGCKQVINAGNWRTADTVRMNDAERWSYTANEVLAVNRYFGGIHKGPNEGWAIVNGDTFTSPSILTDPLQFPLNLKQAVGHPMMVTESAWVMPNGRAVEGPFLISVYQSLTGVDAYYWFATGDDEWTPPQSANGYLASQGKWLFGNPDMLGNFPAAALMYRMGYIQRGPAVVHEERALTDLWQRRSGLITEESGFDPNRDTGSLAPTSAVKTPVPPEAFLVGPVEVVYGGDPARSKVADLAKYIDREKKIIRSITGEVVLNYGAGRCLLNAPKAQGIVGFFKNGGPFKTADATIQCANEFGSIIVTAMDDKPLKTSGKVLVQVGMPSRPTGWEESPTMIKVKEGEFEGYKVNNFGRAPWQVVRADVEVTLANPALKKATILDANGNAKGTATLTRTATGVRLSFPENALYVVLE
jgi:hypothetical protein